MYNSFIKVDQGHHVPEIYLFGVLYGNACVKQRFMTSTTCENTWCKPGDDPDISTLWSSSGLWPSEVMCACWWWTLRTHAVLWHECSFIWFTGIFYETVNV